MIGKTLNHYKIINKLGSGGMGEVYTAEDAKLNRKVALKVLSREMAASTARLGRFEREAKAIAALNHPNIVHIYSIEKSDPGDGETDEVNFLTMELVTGRPLGQVIPKGGLDLRRLLDLGIAMTEAMTAAHEKNITHRDLKPDNIIVGDDGRLKILDFGLAKLKGEAQPIQDASALPTQTVQTEDGRILGTVAYMAPEQAEGKPVDPRTDVFSMGVLLYEMATGERPFKGDTKISVISSIMRDTPTSITDLNRNLPRHLGRIIKQCLAKNPERRYGNARELHNELLELKEELDSGELLAPGAAAFPAVGKKKPLWLGLGAGAVLVALSATVTFLLVRLGTTPEITAPAPLRTTVTRITDRGGLEVDPSISPDGRSVVYAVVGGDDADLFLQRIEGGKVINLTEDSLGDDLHPAFSPNGERIAFFSDRDGGGLYIMGAMGGAVTRLTEEGRHPAWSADGKEVFYDTEDWFNARSRAGVSQLKAVNVETGDIRVVFEGDAVDPAASPNGRRVAFWGLPRGAGQRDIWTIPVEGGEAIAVMTDAATDWSPIWAPDGKFLYFNSDRGGSFNIWRVPIDERTGEVLGEMQPVTTGTKDTGDLSISADGRRIIYEVLDVTNNLRRAGFNPEKPALTGEPKWVTRGSKLFFSADLSPDEQWIAYYLSSAQEDIFVERLDGTGRRKLTDDDAKDRGPAWSPDGKTIAFYSDRSGSYEIWTVQADGRNLRKLTDIAKIDVQSPVWSPDGTRLAFFTPQGFTIIDPAKAWEEQEPQTLPAWDGENGFFGGPTWSPDGKYLAGHLFSRDRPDTVIGMTWEAFGLHSLETGEYERLIEKGEFGDDGPFASLWFSDSRRLLLQNENKLFMFDIESRELTEVEGFEEEDFDLTRLSADDRTLYWLKTNLEGDVWMLEVE